MSGAANEAPVIARPVVPSATQIVRGTTQVSGIEVSAALAAAAEADAEAAAAEADCE